MLLIVLLSYSTLIKGLCVSGSLAMFHFGMLTELVKLQLLPKIISGSSGGSIVAGILACNTDQEMEQRMQTGVLEQLQNGLRDVDGQVSPALDSNSQMLFLLRL